MNRLRHPFACTVLLLAMGGAGCENNDVVPLVGTLERDRISIPAERSEPVTQLHVREGASVQAGDAVLQLDATRAQNERDRLIALRAQAQARVDELVRGPREERIREARANLAAAEAQLENAVSELERINELADAKLASAAQRDNARAAHDSASAARDAARATLAALLEGTTIEELEQARAQLDAAGAAVRAQELLIARLTVTAPRDARVESLPYKTGSQPPSGATVAVLLASGAPYARVHVPAALRDAYAVGASVRVHVPGFGEFPGRVRWVSSEAAFTPYYALTEHDRDRLSYAAEIELPAPDAAALPTGISIEAVAGGSSE